MIEPKTLIAWTHELVAFANGEADPLFNSADADPADAVSHGLPGGLQSEDLRAQTRARLVKLAAWSSTKRPCPKSLLRAAREWLEDPAVTSTHAAFTFVPMDAVLSLTKSGELVAVPRFRTMDAQYAVTFAELLRSDAALSIKRCALATCGNFFVHIRGTRGQPPKACSPAHSSTARVHKFRKRRH